ncbi:hypothetical protein BJ912DRAFT_37485 [Pholiota molesta]|nr:hypothetical protein BJ912DRAFT_37485 [Pholiota molesta]
MTKTWYSTPMMTIGCLATMRNYLRATVVDPLTTTKTPPRGAISLDPTTKMEMRDSTHSAMSNCHPSKTIRPDLQQHTPPARNSMERLMVVAATTKMTTFAGATSARSLDTHRPRTQTLPSDYYLPIPMRRTTTTEARCSTRSAASKPHPSKTLNAADLLHDRPSARNSIGALMVVAATATTSSRGNIPVGHPGIH